MFAKVVFEAEVPDLVPLAVALLAVVMALAIVFFVKNWHGKNRRDES
jgi:hypothetical protein